MLSDTYIIFLESSEQRTEQWFKWHLIFEQTILCPLYDFLVTNR